MGRPKKPLISEQAVVDAATAILEEDGVDALSLRNLGARLGINSTSLYHHFRNKDDILLAVVRSILREMQLPALTDHWQEWIGENAVRYRRLLIDRPFLIPLMLQGIRPHTVAYAVSDAKLSEAGVPDDIRPEFLLVLDTTVVGSALISINARENEDAAPRFDYEKMLRKTIQFLIDDMVLQYQRGAKTVKRSGAA